MIPLTIETASGRRPVGSLRLSRCHRRRARTRTDVRVDQGASRRMNRGARRSAARLTLRGDSLWWFAEITCTRAAIVLALRTVCCRRSMRWSSASGRGSLATSDPGLGAVTAQFAASRGIAFDGGRTARPPAVALACIEARSAAFAAAARLSRLRRRAPPPSPVRVGAFVHTAFGVLAPEPVEAKRTSARCSGNSRSGSVPIRCARSGSDPHETSARGGGGIRSCARPRRGASCPSKRTRRSRPAPVIPRLERATSDRTRMETSGDIRAHAVIRGQDCWLIVRGELAGIARLQLPWSARAMDEAGAALDAIRPGRGRHVCRGRRVGPRDGARVPAPRHSARGRAARVHLPPLAELPSRAGRDGGRSPESRRSRVSAAGQ